MLTVAMLFATAGTAEAGKGMLTENRELQLQSARAKGYTAYAGAGATAAFGIASMATNGSGAPATILGGASLLSFGITLPVGAAGGNQARRLADTVGVKRPDRTLQTVAWVGYGVTLVEGIALVTLGAMDADVPTSLIGTTVLCGTVSTIGMGVDAITTADFVEDELKKGKKRRKGRRNVALATVQPVVAVSRDGATWGVTGTF